MSEIASTSSNTKSSQEKSSTSTSDNALKIKCHLCGKTFNKNWEYKRHQHVEHNKRKKSKKKEKSIAVMKKDQEDLFNALRACPEGDEIKVLQNHVQPGEDLLLEIHNRIVQDLRLVFDFVLQNYNINVFGSTITGLAMKDSDFDFFVSTNAINVDSISDVKMLIRTLRTEVLKHPNFFSHSVPIYSAKVPLLKLTHKLTGIQLDVNFSNSFGIYNSNILQKLVKFDNRIYALVIILKYWGKIYQVTGSGKITNYSFTLMIIFVLQTLDEPIVPPIKRFQDNISPLMVNHCNFSFNERLSSTNKNKMSVFELLKHFFSFYSNFNYNDNIICPYLGKAISRSEYDTYFQTNDNSQFNIKSAMCVQDPFEQNRNIITCCTKENRALFTQMVKASNSVMMDEANESLKSSEILIKLLSLTITPAKAKTKLGKKGKLSERNNFLCKLNVTHIEVQLLKQFLPIKQGNGKVNFHKLWCQYCIDLIKPVLENIYHMDCKALEVSEYQSIELESNILPSLGKQLDVTRTKIYNIKTSCNLWSHLPKPIPYQTKNYIELEYGRAKIQDIADVQAKDLPVNCYLVIKLDIAYNSVEINLFNENDEDETVLEYLQGFFDHFAVNIRSYIRGHLFDNKNINKIL